MLEHFDEQRKHRLRVAYAAKNVRNWIERSTARPDEERAQTASKFNQINPVTIDEELTRPAPNPELYRIKRRRIVYD
jgi:hypothetical protein